MATEYFKGLRLLMVEGGIQAGRLTIWRKKIQQLGGSLANQLAPGVTHVLASNWDRVVKILEKSEFHKTMPVVVSFNWIEECLKKGELLPTEKFELRKPEKDKLCKGTLEGHVTRCSVLTNGVDTRSETTNFPISSIGHMEAQDLGERHLILREDFSGNQEKDKHSDRDLDRGKREEWLKVIKEGAKAGVPEKRKRESGESDEEEWVRRRREERSHERSPRGFEGFSSDEHKLGSDGEIEISGRLMVSEHSTKEYRDGKEALSEYNPPDLNTHITKPFTELKNIYKYALGDERRSFSYCKAISVLEKFPYHITEIEQVKGLPAIGSSLETQIEEILTTGTLQRLKNFKEDPKVAVMVKIVEETAELVQPGMWTVCGGSYRRGKASVGDMDIILTHPDGESHKGVLPRLCQKLREIDFLKENLMVGVSHSLLGTDKGVDTYFGLCCYPGRQQRHRIDFKVYPIYQYPYGLIAWTGNDVLNRRLRLVADKKGYRLDDHGLFPTVRDRRGNKIVKSEQSKPLKSEREVFEFLGFPWLEPHERNL